MATRGEVVQVSNLKKHYDITSGFLKRNAGVLRAVDDVSFTIFEGETLGMVGESGCGKSTIGKSILRAHEITDGSVVYHFDDQVMDVSYKSLKDLRTNGFRKHSQMIFQDPNSSLDPRMTVKEIISEPLLYNAKMSNKDIENRVVQLMERVGLDKQYLKRYPHAFSGGQRQRISIARALSTNPRFIVADEPTSALDVSIQAQILNLIQELQQEFNMSYLFISHNLGVIRRMSDRVAVMYLGRLVELAPNEAFFRTPKHPYSEALMRSVPIADPTVKSGMEAAPGEVGNPLNPPTGCYFHPRCIYAKEVCRLEQPQFREIENERFVACHEADEITLKGVSERNIKV